ncbi:DUF5990 family protein [Micromonospora sp. LZ34]
MVSWSRGRRSHGVLDRNRVDDCGDASHGLCTDDRRSSVLESDCADSDRGQRPARAPQLGAVTDDGFEMFRRAKLLFDDVPGELLRTAHDGAGALVGRLGLTDAKGGPLCARVRPPSITWTVD